MKMGAGVSFGAIAAMLAMFGAIGCVAAEPVAKARAETKTLPEPVAPARGVPSAAPPAADSTGTLGLPPEIWSWYPFPDARCADGSSTGIGVNLRANATHLVVFLEGGGACDDGENCWVRPSASHIAGGYGVDQFGSDPLLGLSLFHREEPANPFRDASYIFVPYCTGDLHAGNNVARYEVDGVARATYHWGAHNLDLYLAKLGAALPSVNHVWLTGESAGGFGALFNQEFVARAFGARTDVIDDSGPGIGISGFPDSWNVRLPPACTYCGFGLFPLFVYDRVTYPDTRFAFLSFADDSLLPGFYGADAGDVAVWLESYEADFPTWPNTRSFVANGMGHVVTHSTLDPSAEAALPTWLQSMVDDDPWWSNETR